MPQHEQLRVLGRRRTTEQNQPAAQPREDEIEQTEGHGRLSCPTADPDPSLQLTGQADFWHPTGPEDWEVRALVRDPSSDRAKALQAEGVHLVRGDLDDDRSVAEAVQGAYGVFSVQGFRPQGVA
ncbi:MAG: NmrA family NAD(P)-binding protein, partial [Streptosporangiaceae bacterium]